MPCFLCALTVGASAPSPDTRDFSWKVLWNLKSFAKMKWGNRGKFLRIFKGLFTKSLLKQGPLTQFQHILTNKKRGEIRVFSCSLSVGAIRPKPWHKGLFVKSPLEPQKLCRNKILYSVGSSLAPLSPKERCVLRFFIFNTFFCAYCIYFSPF